MCAAGQPRASSLTGYRVKPPKSFGRNVPAEDQLRDLLCRSGFRVESAETIGGPSGTFYIPIQYIRAVRV